MICAISKTGYVLLFVTDIHMYIRPSYANNSANYFCTVIKILIASQIYYLIKN